MDSVEMQIKELVAGPSADSERAESECVVSFPVFSFGQNPPPAPPDGAAAALDLVSEAAEAIKCAEDRAAEMMARAQSLASSAAEKVRLTMARIERAEAAKREVEAEVGDCKAEIERLREELKQADARIADLTDEAAAAEYRGSLAQKRASDAEAAIERVVHALRTQLPRNSEHAETKQLATA